AATAQGWVVIGRMASWRNLRVVALNVVALTVAALSAPSAMAAQETSRRDSERMVRCESTDEAVKRCTVDTRRGVRMLRQLSEVPCGEGRSWGVDKDGIWVSHGCRAEFLTGFGGSGVNTGYSERVVRCESRGGRWNQCTIDTSGGMEMVRQLSKNPCV